MIINSTTEKKMDKVIKNPKIPKLNQAKTDALHTHRATKNTEFVRRKIPPKETFRCKWLYWRIFLNI